eukprot:SM000011S19023  [mRNA]  locus=s11:473620:474654:+ [translate_table: standard]
MAAVRLSGMEISDLTMELSDLSQDIAEGVKGSARAVQAAEDGLRRMGNFAASQTVAMLRERASAPAGAVKPAVASAAAGTRQVVAEARRVMHDLVQVQRLSKWLGRVRRQPRKAKATESPGG